MPIHPMLVHLPIALAVLMPLVSLGLVIAWWRGALQRRTWFIAIALQAILVVSGFAAIRSGEAEEDRVESVVAEPAIEAHEEAAEGFLIASAIVLGVSLGAGLIRRERAARTIAAVAALGTLVVLALGYRTGQAGGELVYEHGAATAYATPTTPPTTTTSTARAEEDDDR